MRGRGVVKGGRSKGRRWSVNECRCIRVNGNLITRREGVI